MKAKAALLLALGLLQMGGDLLRLPFLKNVGAATAASPAPKVFCAREGYEPYATRFFLEWVDKWGELHSQPLRAEAAGRLRGPYNRRNVYGAALAYGPILPETLRGPVLACGLRGEAPVLRELGIDPTGVHEVWVRYESLPGTAPDFSCCLGPEAR